MLVTGLVLKVAVAAPVMGFFDYLPPAGEVSGLVPGLRLKVPFGRSTRIGILAAVAAEPAVPARSLKRVLAVLDEEPLLPPDLMKLLHWSSRYYQHPPGDVFATAVPKALRAGGGVAEGEERWVLAAGEDGQAQGRASPVRDAVLAALAAAGPEGLGAEALGRVAAGWRRAVNLLEQQGRVTRRTAPLTLVPAPATATAAPELNPDQARAVAAIRDAAGFQVFLLDGVTGSGKTEVYLQALESTLAAGRQGLVLVPEIALTPQLVDRFRQRFPVPIAELHSGLGDTERLRAWTAARTGAAAIVIGTRSAVFTPLARPGLLVVDEEHDSSYKQQEGFRYSARDLAVWRARELNVPLVLGSATPSLETLENARTGRYRRLELPARAGAAAAPSVRLVDLRRNPPTEGLSQPLLAAIRRHLEAGSQVLIYLNRRGYAPTLLCPDCGDVLECRRCDARLVLHQRRGLVICHHCGAEGPVPTACAGCGGELRPVGQGTERLEAALAAAFPGEEIVRIDRDAVRRRGEIGRRLARVRSAEARILLGTQMLTKGHDFPGVTLVGVVDADQGLFGSDFRSAERLAQSFVQVTGRAGRAERPGEALIQTCFPDHPLLQLLVGKGYGAFAEAALAERQAAGWPPYASLALLRAEAADRDRVFRWLETAADLGRELAGEGNGVRLLGPAPAPMERRAGRLRGQLLVQADARPALQAFLAAWRPALDEAPGGSSVRWNLDVDPIELF